MRKLASRQGSLSEIPNESESSREGSQTMMNASEFWDYNELLENIEIATKEIEIIDFMSPM